MSRRLAIVLDPDNSDPAWGAAEEAAFRRFTDESHYPESAEGNPVPVLEGERIPIYDLIEAALALVDCADHTGCTPDLAVVDSDPLFKLKRVLDSIGE